MQYFPLAAPFFFALLLLVGLVIVLIEIGVLEYAYEKIGIGRRYVFTILLLSFFGSYINIPVAALPEERVESHQVVNWFGVRYVIPILREEPGTIIAVNLGGAVIPTVLSIYLLFKNRKYVRTVAAVAVVMVVVHMLAQPVRGVGIAVPTLVPALVAAITALLIAPRSAAPVAYVAGSLGTLLGADLLNLSRISGLGAPVASIGGAGTFDGIFVSGILAVLLA
jgi:uncharacterized membrane protein